MRGERRVEPVLPEVVRAEIAQQLRHHAVVIVPSVEQVYDVVRTEVVRQLQEPQAHQGQPNTRHPSVSQQDLSEIREFQGPSRRKLADLGGAANGARSPLRRAAPETFEERMRRETLAAFGLDPDDPPL
ncbi:hypothetical protein [Trinickia diaoshuihuensis]|uniref:hypothetical protein n=1 Tax=Trinickia diaoshuihuensis TaxID=2292265 RepID=UPI0013C34A44|nr:hypothetical protein [Trinickia diaoshuihuensis]